MKLLVQGFGKYSQAVDGLAPISPDIPTSNPSYGSNDDENDQIVDQIDMITDEVFDVLFPIVMSNNNTSDQTPIQKIVIQEISKVLGAATRSVWGRLRNQSGKLPTGRTILGMIVDPVGLFSNSNLIGRSNI